MSMITYHVPDLRCAACESSIRRALEPAEGVERVEVDLPAKRVTVHYDSARTDVLAVKSRIEAAGFEVG